MKKTRVLLEAAGNPLLLGIGDGGGEFRIPVHPSEEAYGAAAAQVPALRPDDVVFPVLHGTYGEDGTMQGLLELADAASGGRVAPRPWPARRSWASPAS